MDTDERTTEALRWLRQFYDQEPGKWFSLATLDKQGRWTEEFFPREILPAAEGFVQQAILGKLNLYFSARTFKSMNRANSEAVYPAYKFHADLDDTTWRGLYTWQWETSTGNRQAMWVCDDHNFDEPSWSELNKTITYATGADRGGWAASKMLRVPLSYNLKRGEWVGVPQEGPFMEASLLAKFEPAEPPVDAALLHVPGELDNDTWRRFIDANYDRLPNYIVTELLKPAVKDRSSTIWRTAHDLKELGVPYESAVLLISGAAWNKWRGYPSKLARDVSKVYVS